MKKRYWQTMLICCMLLCLMACASDGGKETVYNNDLIGSQSYTGTYQGEEFSEPVTYSYQLPQLLDDTPDAQQINEEMLSIGEEAEAGGRPLCKTAFWKSFWHGSTASIVVEMTSLGEGGEFLHTINYDFESGTKVSNSQLLEQAGISLEEYREELLRAAAQEFDAGNQTMGQMYEGSFPVLMELRSQTLNGVDPEQLTLYRDEEGTVCGVTEIITPAGGGIYTTTLKPESGHSAHRSATLDYVTVELEDGKAVVTFSDTDSARAQLPEGAVTFGQAYPIEGLYGVYTDLALGDMGREFRPILFLSDENGQISFCDLLDSACHRAPFCAIGPLAESWDIVDYRSDRGTSGQLFYAIRADGTAISMEDPVQQACNSLHSLLQDSSWKAENGGVLHLERNGGKNTWNSPAGQAEGKELLYCGMTGKGMHYRLSMRNQIGEQTDVLLTLFCPYGAEEQSILTVKQLSEEPLPGFSDGDSIKLTRS